MDRNTKNQLRKPKIMTKIEMDAENDKTTKNFDRYKFTNGTVNGSVYLPKGAGKVKVTIEYD
jgi:hypothetical protein